VVTLDIYTLLISAFTIFAAASFVTTNVGSVLLEPIDVPAQMAQKGYGGDAFRHMILNEIQRIRFSAGADYVAAAVQGPPQSATVSVAGTDISVTQAKIMYYKAIGTIWYDFSGTVTEQNTTLTLMLGGHDSANRRNFFTHTAKLDDPSPLVGDAARDILSVIDPYTMMKLQFEADKVTGNFSKSLGMIDDLFPRMDPATYHYLYDIAGRAYDLSGHPDQAIAAYHKAIQHNPNYAITYSNLAVTLNELGQKEEADSNDQIALRLDPQFFMFFRYWADEYENGNDDERCVYNFSRYLHYAQTDARAYYDMGVCLRRLGRAAEAKAAVDRAAALNPDIGTLTVR
jgi:hypothetical protein